MAWVERCYDSISNQTYQDFDVFELDYGGEAMQTYEGSTFFSQDLGNHANAHNFLLDKVFFEGDYDCAFNVNIDDWYSLNRFEKQLTWIEKDYDVVSSNFQRVNENNNGSRATFLFHNKDIVKEAEKGHNIIAHPVLCYSRHFWTTCNDRLNPNEIPADDFALWKRSYKKGYKFIVLPDVLLYQRIHNNNVSKKK